MDTKVILDNLLESSQKATKKGLEIAEQKLGVPESGPERDAMQLGRRIHHHGSLHHWLWNFNRVAHQPVSLH